MAALASTAGRPKRAPSPPNSTRRRRLQIHSGLTRVQIITQKTGSRLRKRADRIGASNDPPAPNRPSAPILFSPFCADRQRLRSNRPDGAGRLPCPRNRLGRHPGPGRSAFFFSATYFRLSTIHIALFAYLICKTLAIGVRYRAGFWPGLGRASSPRPWPSRRAGDEAQGRRIVARTAGEIRR